MAYEGMNAADIVVIILYFIFVIGVGFWSMYRTNRSHAKGYFLAGRSMLWWPVGASLFASNIGTGHFIGLAGTGAASGIAVGAYEIMSIFALIPLGWIFVPVYVSAGVYTMPEYLKKRYGGKRLRIFMSILALFLYIFTKISVDIFAGAIFIQEAFPQWNIYTSIGVLLAITSIYAITGGLAAVIYTDTLQSFIMVIGGLVLMALSYKEIGGYKELQVRYYEAVSNASLYNDTLLECGMPREDAFHLLRHPTESDQPWPGTIIGIMFIGVWYWCTDQVIVQRALSAKNVTHAKAGTVVASYLKILPMFMIVIPGMISRVLFPDEVACVDPDNCEAACGSPVSCSNSAYPKLVLEIMPTGARGLMVAVMMAALMSSLTSIFNSGSTIFTMDIWRRIRPNANNTELMVTGRLFIVCMLVVSILWIPIVQAYQGGQLFVYIQSLQSYFAPPIFTAFVLGVLWRRINEKGAFWGLLIGIAMGVTRMVLDIVYPAPFCGEGDTRPKIVYQIHYLYYNCVVGAVSIASTVIISLLTKPLPDTFITGMTWATRGQHANDNSKNNTDELEMETSPDEKNEVETEDYSNTPIWRRTLRWFCGLSDTSEDSTQKDDALLTSIDEDPFWRKFSLINAVIVMGVGVFLMGYYA
ncbi:sodium/glucose cotransporter 4-like [Anneissia japonica]|uniref:sodium/glucose cotransporter 4-like n=1 Tax=Anneissia japonica TaxID=1529436 RepID=UPI00142569AD|nr:sodium/glucose cotransporter 4-like [Anneissia japonica]